MTFGEAIEAMRQGRRVRRRGWNGKNMHVYLEDGYDVPIRAGAFKGTKRRVDAAIYMYTAKGTHQPGWLASQADMLADDWTTVR